MRTLAKTGPITILVVDDSRTRRFVTTLLLRQQGFHVMEAGTGSEAVQHLQTSPDLVVLDVRLPDADGIELCARIKRDPATAVIPVVLSSASASSDEDRQRGLQHGADAYLNRFEIGQLVPTVLRLLDRRSGTAVK